MLAVTLAVYLISLKGNYTVCAYLIFAGAMICNFLDFLTAETLSLTLPLLVIMRVYLNNDKAISNLRIEKHPSISFKGKEDDMFIDLIIPINNCFNSTNEITNNCNSSSDNEDYYKVSCKIFEITKNINK